MVLMVKPPCVAAFAIRGHVVYAFSALLDGLVEVVGLLEVQVELPVVGVGEMN
jgi:hypothetical protein